MEVMLLATQRWKLKAGATWRAKLETEHPNHGKVVEVPPERRKRYGKTGISAAKRKKRPAAKRK